MSLMFTGISINFIATLYIHFALTADEHYSGIASPFTLVCASLWFISLIGAFLILAKKYKLGVILVGIGSIIFTPIGFIAIFGACKVKDKNQPEPDLEKRRQLYKENKNV